MAVSTPDKEDDQAWLRYWVIISIFYLAEYLLDLLHFLPFYHVLKISFIIWCLLPDPLSGSKILFELVKVVLTVLVPSFIIISYYHIHTFSFTQYSIHITKNWHQLWENIKRWHKSLQIFHCHLIFTLHTVSSISRVTPVGCWFPLESAHGQHGANESDDNWCHECFEFL